MDGLLREFMTDSPLRLCGSWRLCAELLPSNATKAERVVQRKDAKNRKDAKSGYD
jgi:hypothetical protein